MKKLVYLFLTLSLHININAQIEFQERIVADVPGFAIKAYPADLDGDGDMDVVTSINLATIAWYKNTNGLGDFAQQQILEISGAGPTISSLYATDINGDGNMDILSSFRQNFKIFWNENLDGLGNFGYAKHITNSVYDIYGTYPTDIDGDGDVDVISAGGSTIGWFENINGLGEFSTEKVIYSNAGGARSVYAADLDGDGDLDVLSASYDDDTIAWYENDGQASFGPQNIISATANRANLVYAADIDGDEDIDVISGIDDGEIAWYKNTDGQGNFSSPLIIETNLSYLRSIYISDLDKDGDKDVLSASSIHHLSWHENLDGLGNFITWQIAGSGNIYSVNSADIDGDMDMDVISTVRESGETLWYENLGIIGVNESKSLNFGIYPNPSAGNMTFQSNIVIKRIQVYDRIGRIMLSGSNKENLNMSNLTQGIYFVKVEDENGSLGVIKVIRI